MFEKNLNSIKFERSSDRQMLAGTSFFNKAISAHKSASGDFILALNNIPLDDVQNPMEDAKKIFVENTDENLSNSDVVVVFGLGLGYLLKRVFVNSNAKIILYEPEISVLRFAMEYVDFSDVFSSPRVFVAFDFNSVLNKISSLYFDREKINLIFNKSYLYLYSDLIKQISAGIIEAVNTKKSDLKTIELHSKRWTKNFLANFPYFKNTRPINYLKNKYANKTALILCAGPSLKENISNIKKYQDKFVAISLNKNIDYLLANDFIPDFVVASDGMAFLDKFEADAGEYSNINFILSAKCAHSIFERKTKHLWMYYPTNMSSVTNIISFAQKDLLFDKTWGTTAMYAYECAKMMGFREIVFAGLDLAFKKDEHYGIEEKHYTKFIESQINFTTVENVRGEIVQTRNDYALFVKQFEQALEAYNEKNVYNISDFGAKIKGMKYSSLEEIVKNLSKEQKEDNEVIIEQIISSTENKWNDIYKKMQMQFDYVLNEAKTMSLKQNVELNKKNFPQPYYNLSQTFIQNLKQIIENPLLNDYFQYEILTFLHKLETMIIENAEQYMQMQEAEFDFLKNIEQVAKEF